MDTGAIARVCSYFVGVLFDCGLIYMFVSSSPVDAQWWVVAAAFNAPLGISLGYSVTKALRKGNGV